VSILSIPHLRLVEILDEHEGVSLARTDQNSYLVGICYVKGDCIAYPLNPNVDFLHTKSLDVAQHLFNNRSGRGKVK
jgi:hypothetical protein